MSENFFAEKNSNQNSHSKSPKKKRNFSKYYELKKKLTPGSSSKIGKWTVHEQMVFLEFLRENQSSFETDFIRRSTKVFKHLSNLLRTRSPMQCRSHFQKLKAYSKKDTSESVIEHLEYKIWNERRQMRYPYKEQEKVASGALNLKLEDSRNYFEQKRVKEEIKVKIQENLNQKEIIFEVSTKFFTTMW